MADVPMDFAEGDRSFALARSVVVNDELRCLLWYFLEPEFWPSLWCEPRSRTRAQSDVAHAERMIEKLAPILTMFDKIVAFTVAGIESGAEGGKNEYERDLVLEIWFPNRDPKAKLRVDVLRTTGARGGLRARTNEEGQTEYVTVNDEEQSIVAKAKPTRFEGAKARNVLINFVADFPQALFGLPDKKNTFMMSVDIGTSRIANPFANNLSVLCLQNYYRAVMSTRGDARLKIHHPIE